MFTFCMDPAIYSQLVCHGCVSVLCEQQWSAVGVAPIMWPSVPNGVLELCPRCVVHRAHWRVGAVPPLSGPLCRLACWNFAPIPPSVAHCAHWLVGALPPLCGPSRPITPLGIMAGKTFRSSWSCHIMCCSLLWCCCSLCRCCSLNCCSLCRVVHCVVVVVVHCVVVFTAGPEVCYSLCSVCRKMLNDSQFALCGWLPSLPLVNCEPCLLPNPIQIPFPAVRRRGWSCAPKRTTILPFVSDPLFM